MVKTCKGHTVVSSVSTHQDAEPITKHQLIKLSCLLPNRITGDTRPTPLVVILIRVYWGHIIDTKGGTALPHFGMKTERVVLGQRCIRIAGILHWVKFK